MGANVDALKALYVALGGSADDVKNVSLISDMINAIATVAASAVAKELPANPTANGNYLLKATKSNTGTTLSWTSAT